MRKSSYERGYEHTLWTEEDYTVAVPSAQERLEEAERLALEDLEYLKGHPIKDNERHQHQEDYVRGAIDGIRASQRNLR